MSETANVTKMRHILSLSGGKDSSALAIYMNDPQKWIRVLGSDREADARDDRQPVEGMEYAFCDTGEEVPETYEYLDKLEAYLGVAIHRLNPDRPFNHYLTLYGGVLPDARTRWCTRMLKLKPFEAFVGEDEVVSYIAIRADENREGHVSTKPNIKPIFPFKEDGINKKCVTRILEESGLGFPDYYKWRSRSGCYFCFFQRRNEWVGLKENHPEKFEEAKQYEKYDQETGKMFTWNQRESLIQLETPERMQQIREEAARREADAQIARARVNRPFADTIGDDEDDGEEACFICHL
jgi:3'-phosphoadenosine 5'-phosphosulfate sulfotransferase (PAPS reductase)/FAD synthetase